MKKGHALLLTLAIACLPISAQTIQPNIKKPPLAKFQVQTPQPDFVISNCRFELQGHDVKAYATIRNSGNAGAAFQGGQAMAVLAVRGLTLRYNAPAGGYFLGAGQTVEVSPNTFSVAPGTYPAKWTVNPNQVVAEKDFENNTTECQLNGPPPPLYPDPVVTSLSVQPPSGPPGTVFKVTIVVTNQGDAPLPKGTDFIPRVLLDSSIYKFVVNWAGYTVLAVGQSVTHTLTTTTPLAPGTHAISAEIDYRHELHEKDEKNNITTCTFIVTQ